MKIKTTKKLNLPEFIQYVWEGNLPLFKYLADGDDSDDRYIRFLNNGVVKVIGGMSKDDTFTVEVEEIVTPTTRFDELTEYIYDSNDDHHFIAEHKGANIRLIIDCETHQFTTQAIYCKDTLIWTKDSGIPESGVVEEAEG